MKIRTLPALAGAILAAACSTAPSGPNPTLEAARAAYRAASADPQVLRSAPVEIAKAEETLKRADAAWQEGANSAAVDHLAYLAKQQALIAGERGKLAQARQTIETASAERNQILLENRNLALREQQQALSQERERLAMAQRRAQAAEGVAAEQAERSAQLERELRDLAAKATPLGMVMTLSDVLFDVGKASLKPGAERSLDRLAEFMKNHPERKVRIEGFTDATGSPEANQDLSRQRAEVVREQLVQRGIAADRVEAVGYGSAFPVATNATEAGRQQNRRVEIVISDAAGNISRR